MRDDVCMGEYSSKCAMGGGGCIMRIFGQSESNKVLGDEKLSETCIYSELNEDLQNSN